MVTRRILIIASLAIFLSMKMTALPKIVYDQKCIEAIGINTAYQNLAETSHNEMRRFQHANALTIAKLKNIFIKAFKWTTKIQFFSRTTIYFVCDLSYILMTYIIKRR